MIAESNDRMNDEVRDPQMVNIVTTKSFRHHILTTVQSICLVQTDHT